MSQIKNEVENCETKAAVELCDEHGLVRDAHGLCQLCQVAFIRQLEATIQEAEHQEPCELPSSTKGRTQAGLSNEKLLQALADDEVAHEIRLGMDYFDSALWYGMKVGDKTFLLATGERNFQTDKLPPTIKVTKTWIEGSPMSPRGIQRYLMNEDVDGGRLLGELEHFFLDRAVFQNPETPVVLALWTMAGYLHMAFHTFPYIWINSAQRGSGKTRVLELLSAVAFRGQEMMVNPTPAVLYRTLDTTAQVLLIDEFDKSTREGKEALIGVLNAGFNKGLKVRRCGGDNYDPRSYHAYGPKAFAGLDNLPDTLLSRAIPINMLPRSKADKMLPFSPFELADKLQQWRDDLAIWALKKAPACATTAQNRHRLGIPTCLDDRATDYMVPLFAVAKVAGIDTQRLVNFCNDLAESRNADAVDGDATRAVVVLNEWFPAGSVEVRLALSEAAALFGKAAIGNYDSSSNSIVCDSRFAGSLLRKLGFKVKQMRFGAETDKGVIVTAKQLADLVQRFPSSETSQESVVPTP